MAKSATTLIRAYNARREPERLALKMAAMRSNVFSFYRGTAHLFWQRAVEAGVSAAAPAAWCSGDLHLENFGTYRGNNGLAYFDINDFDEAALAPCDWELLRFLSSIFVAAPSLGVNQADAKALALSAAEHYRSELIGGKARWIERRTAAGAVGQLLVGLKKRSQALMLERRTVLKKGRRRLDIRNERLLAVTEAERLGLEAFAKATGKARDAATYFTFLDAARRVAGTGSLGIARFVLLLEGMGSPDGNVLLDLKAAMPSSLSSAVAIKQTAWPDDAHRIVAVQQRCQAISPALLSAVTYAEHPFVLKELQPSADRLNLARIASDQSALADALRCMAELAAWAQLRSSGRDGSATIDGLIDFAHSESGFATRLVSTARDLAAITLTDYKSFCADHDAA